jgi:hypothetical protein
MSIIGTRTGDGRVARRSRSRDAERIDPAAKSLADTPYRLLWSAGIIAFVLGMTAFVLWGINGAGIMFDMIVALCT